MSSCLFASQNSSKIIIIFLKIHIWCLHPQLERKLNEGRPGPWFALHVTDSPGPVTQCISQNVSLLESQDETLAWSVEGGRAGEGRGQDSQESQPKAVTSFWHCYLSSESALHPVTLSLL